MDINISQKLPLSNTDSYYHSTFENPPSNTQKTRADYRATISKLSQASRATGNQADSPLSDAELEQLFTVYARLGSGSPLIGDIGNILTEISGNDRTNFLSVISIANDELENVLTLTKELKEDDRSLFLRTAVRVGNGNTLSGLTKAVDKISEEHQTLFLKMADQLGRTVESMQADELSNFILAAAESPKLIETLTLKTGEFEEENKSNFLKAAATAGRQLGHLIETTDRLNGHHLKHFLGAGAKARDGLENLITLTDSLTGKQRGRFLAFTSELSGKDTENFLLATQEKNTHLDQLMAVVRTLSEDEKASFLSLAADQRESIVRLMNLVQSFDPETADLNHFLNAAGKIDKGFGNFMGITERLDDAPLSQMLSFASTLTVPDMASFITAAKGADPPVTDMVTTGQALSGKEKSHFLYAASLMQTGKDNLIALTNELEGKDRKDFLHLAAKTTEGLDTFVDTVAAMEDSEKTDYLVMVKKAGLQDFQNSRHQEYTYLNAAFDEKMVTAILDTDEKIDTILARIEQLNTDQRRSFLSLAQRADKEMLPAVLSITEKLNTDENQRFVAFTDTLKGQWLNDFITTADNALKSPSGGHSTFSKLMSLVEKLPDPILTDFLNASAGAERSLAGLIDMTIQLGGMQRAQFLIAADNVADLPESDRLINTLVNVAQKAISDMQESFMTAAVEAGRRPSQVISENSLIGTQDPPDKYLSLEDVLKSGAWLSMIGADDKTVIHWIDSFQVA